MNSSEQARKMKKRGNGKVWLFTENKITGNLTYNYYHDYCVISL